MKLGITAALVILASALCRWVLYVREFCQIIITENFGHAPWWERKNGTVWVRGKPVVKTVQLVAA